MKLLLKKINRGVILTLAVVLVIAGYYVVQEIRLAPEKKAITEVGKQFGEIYRHGKIRDEGYRDFVEYPTEVLTAHKEAVKKELTAIYAKDAPGIELWMTEFFENSTIENKLEYRSKYEVKFLKAQGFKISGEEAGATFIFLVDSEINQTIAGSSSTHLEEYELSVGMTFVKEKGMWRVTGASVAQTWGVYYERG